MFPLNLFVLGLVSLTEAYNISMLLNDKLLVNVTIITIMWTSSLFGMNVYALWKRTFILIHRGLLWGLFTLLVSAIILFICKPTFWPITLTCLFVLPLFLIYVALDTNLIIKTHRYGVYS